MFDPYMIDRIGESEEAYETATQRVAKAKRQRAKLLMSTMVLAQTIAGGEYFIQDEDEHNEYIKRLSHKN